VESMRFKTQEDSMVDDGPIPSDGNQASSTEVDGGSGKHDIGVGNAVEEVSLRQGSQKD
jgi:hypothetical protein